MVEGQCNRALSVSVRDYIIFGKFFLKAWCIDFARVELVGGPKPVGG